MTGANSENEQVNDGSKSLASAPDFSPHPVEVRLHRVNHTYTDQEYDSESGLMYYNARYYDTDLKRFTSFDHWNWGEKLNSQTQNHYSYVINNPMRYVDPTGKTAMAGEGFGFPADQALVLAEIGLVIGRLEQALAAKFGEFFVDKKPKKAKKSKEVNISSATGGGGGSWGSPDKKPKKDIDINPKVGSFGGEKAGKHFTKKDKNIARNESNNTCVFCKRETNIDKKTNPLKSEIDHAIPRSRGGNNSPYNRQNTCRTCNRRKGKLTSEEFLQKQGVSYKLEECNRFNESESSFYFKINGPWRIQ